MTLLGYCKTKYNNQNKETKHLPVYNFLAWCSSVFLRQVRCDRLLIPANVDVAELTRVLHVLVDGDTQPRVLTCLWGRVSHKLVVVLVQTKVMATDMALKVKMC